MHRDRAPGSASACDARRRSYYPPRPNILWITCEDISPYLGCYGDPLAITPNLDRLAGRSIRYTNAYATAPVCSPSRSCLITGVYATSLGTQHLRSDIAIPRQIEPFPKLLRAAGYYCSNNFKEDYNFKDPTIWDDSSPTAHWRNRRAGQPFFSVFNITATHQGQINGSDEEFEEKYGSKLKPEERHDPRKIILPPYYPDTPMVRKIWARYYDLITIMDKQVGELLAQLETDALAESTIVFFFSDHGMGLPRFKRTLYDSGLRVPLMVRVPAPYQSWRPSRRAAGRISSSASSISPRRCCPWRARRSRPHMQGQPFLGRAPAAPREYIVGAASRVDEAYEMSRCVRDKRYKYIRNFLPHLPYVQPSDYCDQAEIMQELRQRGRCGRAWPGWRSCSGSRPSRWRSCTTRWSIRTRSATWPDSPEHQETLSQMRKRLRDWMLETKDTGLLPEAEMHIRAAGSTPYDMAHDPREVPRRRAFSTRPSSWAGTPKILPAMIGVARGCR